MQLGNVHQFPTFSRPLRRPNHQQPGGQPPEQPQGDGWCQAGKAGAAVLSAAGLGYAGFHGGAMAGGLLGLMLTQPGSGLGDPGLLGNVVTGLRVGAISGALIGAAGGACLVYLISDLLQGE
ncbi:hypothetical protein JST97_24765 [bacterium]|nr:hypothetical protein [bacterium]